MKFIGLTLRQGHDTIQVCAEKINTIKSLHASGKGWEWSVVTLDNGREIEVTETDAEIISKINYKEDEQ